jgi:hypothetical protein
MIRLFFISYCATRELNHQPACGSPGRRHLRDQVQTIIMDAILCFVIREQKSREVEGKN